MEKLAVFVQVAAGQRYALRPDVVSTVIDDGAVLLDLESKYFYRVNASGWGIVQLFESGATLDEVKTRCRDWGAPSDDDAAIQQFIDALVAQKLLSAVPDGPLAPVSFQGPWTSPAIERQAEPLHRLISSAFDPSIPLAE